MLSPEERFNLNATAIHAFINNDAATFYQCVERIHQDIREADQAEKENHDQ